MGGLLHVEDLSCAARLQVSWYLRLHLESTILTCLQKVYEAQMKSWQGHGCLRKVKLLADREELVRG